MYISFAGLIGSGKTTIATILSEQTSIPLYKEVVSENRYLPDFYKYIGIDGINPYAFQLEVYILLNRWKQQLEIIRSGHGGIQDRSIYEDIYFITHLYINNNLSEKDYITCKELYEMIIKETPKPDMIVFLDVPPKIAYQRAKRRGRDMEKEIPLEYFVSLSKYYDAFIELMKTFGCSVLHVPYDEKNKIEDIVFNIKKISN